jgi:hypothetical protein
LFSSCKAQWDANARLLYAVWVYQLVARGGTTGILKAHVIIDRGLTTGKVAWHLENLACIKHIHQKALT